MFVLQIAPYIFTSTAPPHIFTIFVLQNAKVLVEVVIIAVAFIGGGGVVVVCLFVFAMSFSGFAKATCQGFLSESMKFYSLIFSDNNIRLKGTAT